MGDVGGCIEVGQCSDTPIRLAGFNLTTIWYRSPEIVAGQTEASGGAWLRADVWALGIILFEVVGFTFHMVKTGVGEVQRLARALRESLGEGLDSRAPIRLQVSSRPMEDRLGWAGVDPEARLLSCRGVEADCVNQADTHPRTP